MLFALILGCFCSSGEKKDADFSLISEMDFLLTELLYLGLGKVNETCKHTGKLRRKRFFVLFCFRQKKTRNFSKNDTINENMVKRVRSMLSAGGSVSGQVLEDLGQRITG